MPLSPERFWGSVGDPVHVQQCPLLRRGATSARLVQSPRPHQPCLPLAPLLFPRSFLFLSCHLNGVLGGDEINAYQGSLSYFT